MLDSRPLWRNYGMRTKLESSQPLLSESIVTQPWVKLHADADCWRHKRCNTLEPAYDIFVLGSIAMLPVWFCAWCLSGKGGVWKGCAGKTIHARKKLHAYEMFGWSSSFWWTQPKKVSTLFKWVFWVKTGVDLLFFYFEASLCLFKALQKFQTRRVCC